jgi:hypothetical protein
MKIIFGMLVDKEWEYPNDLNDPILREFMSACKNFVANTCGSSFDICIGEKDTVLINARSKSSGKYLYPAVLEISTPEPGQTTWTNTKEEDKKLLEFLVRNIREYGLVLVSYW